MQWLGEQLNTDERIARAAEGHISELLAWVEVSVPAAERHIEAHEPARVLREIEAKRRIVARHQPHVMGQCRVCEAPHWGVKVCNHCYGQAWPCPDVRDIATTYADRPGYREE